MVLLVLTKSVINTICNACIDLRKLVSQSPTTTLQIQQPLLKPSPKALEPPLAPLHWMTRLKFWLKPIFFFETKFSETETLKRLARVSIPRSFETEMSISALYHEISIHLTSSEVGSCATSSKVAKYLATSRKNLLTLPIDLALERCYIFLVTSFRTLNDPLTRSHGTFSSLVGIIAYKKGHMTLSLYVLYVSWHFFLLSVNKNNL